MEDTTIFRKTYRIEVRVEGSPRRAALYINGRRMCFYSKGWNEATADVAPGFFMADLWAHLGQEKHARNQEFKDQLRAMGVTTTRRRASGRK